jgi:alpha-tubulin suppressor-like RCC1 family protein
MASAFVALTTVGMSAAHAASFEDWANVSVGGSHTCGVRSNGKLYCWGGDSSGEVGDGADDTPDTTPHRIGTFEDWANVSAGYSHTCGVRKNGKLYCWGGNFYGQVGDGGTGPGSDVIAPKRIGTFLDWANVSAGYSHTCGVRRNGKLYCWGDDGSGQVGDGGSSGATTPRRIGAFEDWATVAAGNFHACGVRKNGKLYCWGGDNIGQVGDGGENSDAIPEPERIGTFEDWATVDAGSSHTCGVRSNGKLYCWGYDGYGQIGDGGGTGATTPRRIGTFEDWAQTKTGTDHSCGVRENGKLYCWGRDIKGQVGDGGTNSDIDAPKRIGSFEDWATADAGDGHTCGIRHDGKLYCWGDDASGQVGDGGENTPVNSTPIRI